MALKDDLISQVCDTLKSTWKEEEIESVPEPKQLLLN